MASIETVSKRDKVKHRIRYHVVTVTHADLTDADTSQDIDLATADNGDAFPANAWILERYLVVGTDFSGGSVSALTCQVGDAADPDELLLATSVFTGAANNVPLASNGAAGYGRWEAAYAPIARFTSTTDNLVNLTAGSVSIVIVYKAATLS